MERPLPTIDFDDHLIRVTDGGSVHRFAWSDVERIGYRTIATWGDDHLLEFQLRDGSVYRLATHWPGSDELSERVHALPGTRIGEQGVLANRLDNASVVVWPAHEAGRALDGG